ncbi:carboxypeptidase-like regulatory domain-containing protein [Planctomicrobium sp. SH664]|uniref:carboxypeptidase-like regulatory domain-containing protein n=1 Tax=Planctomicrobium sp. SH664 TaxID=3448125 RepID=UPI003F5C1EF3
MRKYSYFARLAACAAGLSVVIPAVALQAGEKPASTRQIGSDVVLVGGTLKGQYVTATGAPIDGAQIVVRQGTREISRTTTDAKGVFTVSNLKTGAYEIQSPNGLEVVRAWDSNVAPANSAQSATIVKSGVVRGQGGSNTTLTYVGVGLGAIGATTGIIALAEDDDHSHRTVSP